MTRTQPAFAAFNAVRQACTRAFARHQPVVDTDRKDQKKHNNQYGPERLVVSVCARNASKASLNADGFSLGAPWCAFGIVTSCDCGMQRCAAASMMLRAGPVSAPGLSSPARVSGPVAGR